MKFFLSFWSGDRNHCKKNNFKNNEKKTHKKQIDQHRKQQTSLKLYNSENRQKIIMA